ncbi:MAG: DUF2029 domain-containing protein [Leptospiraceae bacterium]|nr:DUF2029 domain-containing protein [Leptospiraceae bacterium]
MLEKFKQAMPYFVILLLLLLLVQSVGRASNKSDFQDYYNASKLFYEQKDLYNLESIQTLKEEIKLEDLFKLENLKKLESLKGNVGTYIYPPLFAFLLIPFGMISYPIAATIFTLINFFCLLTSLFLITKFISFKNTFSILFFTLVINYRYLESHVSNNQVAFILILLMLLSIYVKSDALAGILLSLAILIKLTPAIFLFYFLYKRQFKRFGYTLLFSFVWTLLPSFYSHEYNLHSLGNWYDLVLNNAMKNPAFRSWKNNQSLIATIAKYFMVGADPLNQALFGMPFLDLEAKTIKYIFYLCSLLIGIPFLYKLKNGFSDVGLISILFILSAIFSGVSWVHSFVVLLFPIAYLLHKIFENENSGANKKFFIVTCVITIVTSRNLIGSTAEGIFLMFSLLLYTSIAFYLILLKIENGKSDAIGS